MANESYYIGVDVGTGSVRAGLFDASGKMLTDNSQAIDMFYPDKDFVEQSSTDIWSKACAMVKKTVSDAGIKPELVKGIGFDATCSLVALDENDNPVSISPSGKNNQNIIVWMDHRAIEQADRINTTGSRVLDYVGGKISPEMEIPKILWLKENNPNSYQKTAKYFDLPDFLVYKASGQDKRSSCSKACKWTYLAHEKSWDTEFFAGLGLGDLLDNDRLGAEIMAPGELAGSLTDEAAQAMGLHTDVKVAISLIDAHAGGIGVIGAEPTKTLAVIAGTSNCHMASSKDSVFVDGVWGPYYNAMIPDFWLSEGGQSSAGSLIDHVVENNSLYPELKSNAEKWCTANNIQSDTKPVYEYLNHLVLELEKQEPYPTANFHLLGYFHGNRSPRANPRLKGMISGLSLNQTETEIAIIYLAAIQSVAYGTRHIIEEMNNAGHKIDRIHMCGGLTKNPIWVREFADTNGLQISLPKESEAVLLGSAMLGAAAAGTYQGLAEAMANMSGMEATIQPRAETKDFHAKKYKVFKAMYDHQMNYKEIMKDYA